MNEFSFKPRGVCATEMIIQEDDGVIVNVKIINGCRGNTQAVSKLLVGMSLEEAVKRLEGIQCHNGTSCPDQLAKGIKDYLKI